MRKERAHALDEYRPLSLPCFAVAEVDCASTKLSVKKHSIDHMTRSASRLESAMLIPFLPSLLPQLLQRQVQL
jgi:hypothetical protein